MNISFKLISIALGITLITSSMQAASESQLDKNYKFQKAAYTGNLDVVKNMIDQMSKIQKNSALHNAAGMGREDVVKFLLTQGVDINWSPKPGGLNPETPLLHAARQHHLNIVNMLIDAGAPAIDIVRSNLPDYTRNYLRKNPAIEQKVKETLEKEDKERQAKRQSRLARYEPSVSSAQPSSMSSATESRYISIPGGPAIPSSSSTPSSSSSSRTPSTSYYSYTPGSFPTIDKPKDK